MMSTSQHLGQVEINVYGSSSTFYSAERGVVTLEVHSEGSDQGDTIQDVAKTASKLRNQLEKIDTKNNSKDSAVTHWSQSSLSTGTYTEYNENGKKHRKVFTATTKFEVKFQDFAELGKSVTKWSSTEFIRIQNIDWRLTEKKKASLAIESRKNAVKDAINKASDFAEALSKSRIRAIEVHDQAGGHGGASYMRSGMQSRGGGGGQDDSLNFQPQDVEVACSVRVKFMAE